MQLLEQRDRRCRICPRALLPTEVGKLIAQTCDWPYGYAAGRLLHLLCHRGLPSTVGAGFRSSRSSAASKRCDASASLDRSPSRQSMWLRAFM